MRTYEWDDVAYALEVSRTGSLSAAARRLDVHTATVGRRVRRLEDALQATLFDRTPTGLRPTAAGYRVLEIAEEAEAALVKVRATALADDRRARGVVRLATAPLLAEYLVVPQMGRLREQYPELDLHLVTRREQDSLASGSSDLAFRLVPEGVEAGTPGMIARRLGAVRFRAYAHRDYLRARPLDEPTDSLRGHFRIGYDETPRQPGQAWLDGLADPGTLVSQANQMPVVAAMVEQGLGIGVLLQLMARRFPHLRPVSPPLEASHLFVVMPAPHRSIARVRVVADWLAEVVTAGVD